jgi:hypothetical protein
MAAGLVEYSIPDKPNSRLQKYQMTPRNSGIAKEIAAEAHFSRR